MKLGYLVNQYPKVSHTFIRREIHAVERQGLAVQRYAVRGWDAEVVDAADRQEQSLTHYLLRGRGALVRVFLATVLGRPARFLAALRLALSMGRRADRPWPLHLVYLVEACLLRVLCEREGVDHLHAHFGTNPAEVAMLCHALGGPGYSFTVHGPEEFDKPEFIGLREKILRSRFVVGISSYGRSQLWRWLPARAWSKVQVVHCGLEDGFFAAEASLAPSTAGRLVCIGRLCEQKGQLLLIEAAARLWREGRRFELVLAGDGEMRPDVERAIAEHGLRDCVRITGWIDSDTVRAELLAARAMVLPSFAEGLPVAIMEALAQARPVIATMVAGIPELIRGGVEGWLVPAGDIDALAQAMRACLDATPEALAAMARAGWSRVSDRHRVDAEAARLAALFRAAGSGVQP